MIRIVLTSDNHLNRYYAKMSREQLRQRRRTLRDAWRQTVDFALQQRAHLYLHAGDLFDQPDPNPGELTAVAREFQRLREAGVRVVCISGNHDMPRAMGEGGTPVRIYEELRAARVFMKRAEVEFALFEIEGQTIAVGGLAPDPRAGPDTDPLQGVECHPPDADVRVLLMHCGVEDAVPDEFGETVLRKATIAGRPEIDYYFCGDLHHANRLDVAHASVFIPGATERMTFGEIGEKPGYYYFELDGKRLHRAIRHTIEPQPMERIPLRTTELPAEQPTEYLFNRISEKSRPNQLLQMVMEGPLSRDTYHALRWFEVWRVGTEHNFYFDLDRTRVFLRSGAAEGPAGADGQGRVSTAQELEQTANEMIDQADSVEARQILEEARDLVLSRYRDR